MTKKYSFLSFLLLIMFSFFLVHNNSFAQGVTTSAMNGTIIDAKGDPLPGANIIAVHSPSGTQYGTTSRIDGKYNLNGLRTGGPYIVTVSFVGYKSQESTIPALQLGQNLRVDYTLVEDAVQLGDITVIGEKNSIISSNRTGATQNVTARDIELVPSIGKNFGDLAKLSPQASGINNSIAGRNNRYNNIQIDGTQYNDLFGLGASGAPGGQTGTNPISIDAIQEFQVIVAPYDVKYGSFTGGGLNAITRSGTNRWTGSIYGYGRNQVLVGNGTFITDKPETKSNEQEYPEFKEYAGGFRLGGPIIKDKLFMFLNGEVTRKDQPLSNISLVTGPASAESLADQFNNILKSKGMDAGTYGATTIEQPSNKFFIRLDFNQSENHKFTLRHNYVNSYQDILAGRNANNQVSFNTFNYRIRNITNSTVLQLNSTLGNNFSNDLILGFTSIRDRRAGTSETRPEVRVMREAVILVAGPDRFSSVNELNQDIFEFTDNFSAYFGNHVLTVGTHNEFFTFRNAFIRSFFGYYEFNTLADLQNNTPSYYQKVFSRVPGVEKPAARFSVNQLGFYLQDEWTVVPTFKVTFGVRADIPFLPTEPDYNPQVTENFPDYKTSDVPSGNIMFSPRFGFNWDVSGNRSTQVRGGVGIFTGRIPYVWMSNNYGNTGTLLAEVNQASGGNVGFSVDPYNQPGVGDPGTGSPNFRSEIDLIDPDFKWPQILRANLGVDQELPGGMIGTVEFMYSKSINDLVYQKLNLNPSTSTIPGDGRPRYGGTNSYSNRYVDVLYLTNTDEGNQINFSVQLQRNVASGLSFNVGYNYGITKDINSVLSSQAQSQIRYNPISSDPNKPPLTYSSFDMGHRGFAAIAYSHEFFDNLPTTISFFYNIQSGRRFSFTVNGDLNNDGLNGNDLFYIPKDENDILVGAVTGGAFVENATQKAELFDFIKNNEYLSDHKGQMSERNASRGPWNDLLDMRITQAAIIPGIGRFEISLDIQNVMNLIQSEWGWFQTTPQDTYTIVTLNGTDPATGRPVYRFSKPTTNTPWSPNDLLSRWQMQLGLRYSF
ncbi:MAG: TonB-dependent receptor [Ignavibacterium sp.]|nr:TonB-dependent receptor [Ignavibacterium sp.]